MKKIVLFGLLLVSFVGFSQVETVETIEATDEPPLVIDSYTPHEQRDEKPNDPNQVYAVVEVMPQYPGGMDEFRKFVAKNYKFPKVDKDIKGNVLVQFVIEEDGSLSDIKVIRDLGHGTGEEAVRVVGLSEKWKPGILNGKPVRVRYTLPIQVDVKENQE